MQEEDFHSGGLSLVTKLSKNFVEGVSPSNSSLTKNHI